MKKRNRLKIAAADMFDPTGNMIDSNTKRTDKIKNRDKNKRRYTPSGLPLPPMPQAKRKKRKYYA